MADLAAVEEVTAPPDEVRGAQKVAMGRRWAGTLKVSTLSLSVSRTHFYRNDERVKKPTNSALVPVTG